MKSGNQTKTGKAFEYACALALCNKYTDAELEASPQCTTAKEHFQDLAPDAKENYLKAASAAVKIIDRLEPMLSADNEQLKIKLQTDAKGIAGDVRDVVCIRGKNWQIGLSCKHNHEAVKHSRLSDKIDFGKEWLDIPCSDTYLTEARKIFGRLRKIRDDSKAGGKPAKWNVLKSKEDECYLPILNAFIEELQSMDKQHPKEIPARMINYLLGNVDFYKVIANESGRYTKIEVFNIGGTLNNKYKKRQPLLAAPKVKLPTKFYEIGFKDNSKNTLNVVCDEGWNLTMRIHNASSKIEPSLKFDIQLIATPSAVLTQVEPWDEN